MRETRDSAGAADENRQVVQRFLEAFAATPTVDGVDRTVQSARQAPSAAAVQEMVG